MSRRRTQFNIDNYDEEDLGKLAYIIRKWLDLFENTSIIPDDIRDEIEGTVDEGKKRTKKLLQRLDKGDMKVIVDDDDILSI